MKKEDVLKMSRKENEGKHDEREMAAYGAASKVGMLVGGILCVLLVLLTKSIFKAPEVGLVAWMIYFAMQGSHGITMYAKLKSKRELICGIVYAVFAIAFLVALCIVSLG